MTITRAAVDAGLVDFSDLDLTGETIEPVSPGEFLADALAARRIRPAALADAMHVPVNRVTGIMRHGRAITVDTAIRLGRALGTSPDFWLGLQDAYHIALALADGVGDDVQPARAYG